MSFQEYPKWVSIPDHKDGGVVVFSEDEERATSGKKEEKRDEFAPAPAKRGRPRKE